MRITESALRRIIHQEARRITEMGAIRTLPRDPASPWATQRQEDTRVYEYSADELIFGKAKTLFDQLVMELTTINSQMAKGLDAMDIETALDDSGPGWRFGSSDNPLHQAVWSIHKDEMLGDFFYNGDYRRRQSPKKLGDALMKHMMETYHEGTLLRKGEEGPDPFSTKMSMGNMLERIKTFLGAVKTLKKSAAKAASMGPGGAVRMLTVGPLPSDGYNVSYSGPDVEIRSGRNSTDINAGEGTAEMWATELDRLAKWCSTKKTVEMQQANSMSVTVFDADGEEIAGDGTEWLADGREMGAAFKRLAKLLRQHTYAEQIEIYVD